MDDAHVMGDNNSLQVELAIEVLERDREMHQWMFNGQVSGSRVRGSRINDNDSALSMQIA